MVSALIGWVIEPVSGFPLLLSVGAYTVAVARREQTERALHGT